MSQYQNSSNRATHDINHSRFLVDGRGLSKVFGTLTAVSPLDIAIKAGERVALVGPSGSGKSTILYILAGLIPPDSGDLFLDSKSTVGLQPGRELSESVGLIRQQLDLVPQLPVVQNVLAGRLGKWGLLRSLVSLFSARERDSVLATLSKLGIADKIDEPTSQLSGGEQQRVAIARLMLQAPVSSLDPARADEILRLLTGLADDIGGVMVASLHAPDLIREHFTRVIGLREGVLQFDIPSEELMPSVLEALYDLDQQPIPIS